MTIRYLVKFFFIDQQDYYYHRLLCHSLVRSVILLGIMQDHFINKGNH